MRLSRDPAARRRLAILAAAAAVALILGIVIGAGAGDGDTPDEAQAPAEPAQERRERSLEAVDRLTLRQQVGQVIVSCFPDPSPPDYVRRRLRAGETAGVILFGYNASGAEGWRRLTGSVQRHAGGRALVMVDQEGGEVRTVDFAGPAAGQPEQGDPASVRSTSREAARQLADVGVNVNLAPVADVPGGAAPVMGFRAFAGDAAAIAAATLAAIEGMRAGGVAATPKHFPGLGRAQVNTDDGSATVEGGLDQDLIPFEAAVDAGAPLVMLSHALYPAVDAERIASQSAPVVRLLREDLGYDGVVVTDSMEAQAVLDRSGVARAAQRSLEAGSDLILTTGSASWNLIHPWLMRAARRSPQLRDRIRQAAARVLALKEELGLLR